MLAHCGSDDHETTDDTASDAWSTISLASLYAEQAAESTKPVLVRREYSRDDWSELGRDQGRWLAPLPAGASTVLGPLVAPPTLTVYRGDSVVELEYLVSVRRQEAMPDDSFTFRSGAILVRTEDGTAPSRAVFSQDLNPGWEDAGRWRVSADRLTTDGFLVSPANTVEMLVSIPDDATLLAQLDAPSPIVDELQGTAELTVTIEGDAIASVGADARELHVDLRDYAGQEVVLGFRSSGEDALWRVRVPEITPPVEKPDKPHIFVFLADTFRADNLTAYGGEPGWTPNLDRFAEQSALFERVWASASWTLPSHASIFFSTHAPQHGAISSDNRVIAGLPGLADQLAEAGYRTAAITDSMFVSQRYGLDRGFQWFREYGDTTWDVARILDELEILLDRSDGRPWLVFIQTYRTHGPYRVSDETVAEKGRKLPDPASMHKFDRALKKRHQAFMREHFPGAQLDITPGELVAHPAYDALVREVGTELGMQDLAEGGVRELTRLDHLLYRGAVRDLDRSYGRYMDILEGRGLIDTSYVLFTSDHGELFGEHGQYRHGEGVWEPLMRVPLLVRGPGIQPGRLPTIAGHPDLAPTIFGLVDIPAPDSWVGRDLFDDDTSPPLLTFESRQRGGGHAIWVDWPLKTIYSIDSESEAPEAKFVFDLGADQHERENRVADYPDPSAAAVSGIREASKPLGTPRSADVDVNLEARLRAMGYAIGHDPDR